MTRPSISRREFLARTMGAGAGAALGAGLGPAWAADDAPPGGASVLDSVKIDPATVVGKEGFFRVGKSEAGRWWLLRPDGRPLLYRGVCALWINDPGREALAYRRLWEKQNGEDIDKFVAHCLGILRELGFNALGEWATQQFWNRGWPFTELIHLRQVRRQSNLTGKLPDIFDPAWQKAYEGTCAKVCPPLRDKKDLVGYFVDNEGGWYQARRDFVWEGQTKGGMVDKNVLGREPLLLQMFLAAEPKRPGHRAAWDWVLKRHGGSLAQVAKDWGAEFDSAAKLIELHNKGLALATRAFRADQDAFTTHFTREFFRLTGEAIRRHDPNHLLLGGRHGGPPGDVVMKAYDRRYVDVVSFNNYRPNFKERADEYYKHTKMPMLNGEFSWASGGFLDWNKFRADKTFSDEEKAVCRRKGIAALEGAFTHPGLIGYTWFKFCYNYPDVDGPTYALIDPKGRQNRFNAALLKQIHPRLEGIAVGRIEPSKA